ATDPEDGDLGTTIAWTSDLAGPLGSGPSLVVDTLLSGTHTLTAAVTDRDGRQASAHVTVVVDAASTLVISAPVDGTVYAPGEDVSLMASASDLEEGNLGAAIVWTSDLAGHLGTGATLVTHTLPSGSHTFTATVTDRDGKQASAHVGILVNTPPTLVITAPASGALVAPGDALSLAASATDPEDGDLGDAVAWSSSLDGPLGGGRTLVTTALHSGTHIISAIVTDRYGAQASASTIVVVNATPTVTITAPPGGTVYLLGDTVVLAATAGDVEDGDLRPAISWSSSLDGSLGTGPTLTLNTLRAGTHHITASVTDHGGLTGSASLTIAVDTPPVLAIQAPANGAIAVAGQPLSLIGGATDAEDGDLGAAITWSSNLDGPLGSGATRTVSTLRAGTHTLTATVADAAGASATRSITVLVDTAPSVTITAPASGLVISPGDALTLDASASDAEDGPLTSAIVWTSNIDGPLGSGAPLGVPALHSGTHTITAAVSDASGVSRSATITVVVNAAPTLTITAPASGSAFAFNEPIVLTANAADLEDGNLGAAVVWSSNLDGILGMGATLNPTGLHSGTHTITAQVTDAGGKSASTSITLVAAPLITFAGPYTTTYNNDFLLPKTYFDATTATFYAGPSNLYPVDVEGGAGVVFHGGNVVGQYDRTWTWDQMHTLNNAAIAFDNNDFTVDGLRADNVEDGLRPRKGDRFTIRNVHLSYVRDDCVENDHVQEGLVDDSLFDGCYSAFSARPSAAIIASGFDGSGKVWTIQNSLIRLQPMPGPRTPTADNLGNNSFFKWHLWNTPDQSLSPKLALHDNIFMAERVGEAGADRMGIPPGKLDSCSNNIMVWLGPGDFPTTLPACFTVTTDRTVWDNAVADWLARHPNV
ncbi:MAG TPA: hypothetical protein VKD67_00110, partial [Acidimicrobiales bacterium]|nr:hypothetical protein [Acidimicrobiales bacterium]